MCHTAQCLWCIVWSCTFVVANPVVQENPVAAFCAVTIGAPQGSLGWSPGGGSGHGRGGGHSSEGGAEMLREAHLQQQIILALQRLREDMRSVMDRLEVLERLAATHAHDSDLRSRLQCSLQQEQMSWPFDMSGQTVVFLLLWPFVAHCLVYLLRKKSRMSS